MSKPQVGKIYLYRDSYGHFYTVRVIKAGWLFSMCRWTTHDLDYDIIYEKVGRKANWRLMEEL